MKISIITKQAFKFYLGSLTLFLVLNSLQAFGDVRILPQTNVQLSSKELFQGDLVLVTIITAKKIPPHLIWMQKDIPLNSNTEKTKWYGFLDAGLGAMPGDYTAAVILEPDDPEKSFEFGITLKAKDYGVRNLTLPKELVDLDEPTLERVKKENTVMNAIWYSPPLPVQWTVPFIKPLSGEVIGPFGVKSVINGQPRSPHSGADFRGERGTPVKAVNYGRVVLIADHFFTGHTVVIDHGGAIQSMYFHLDQVLVQPDQNIAKGEIIGVVGSTGRATGPHLHFGMRVNGTAIEPLSLIALSEQIVE